MAEMTWQKHPDVELPSLVTLEAHEALYAPRGVERIEVELDTATDQFGRPITRLDDLSTTEVNEYREARVAEAAEAEKERSGAKASKSRTSNKANKDDDESESSED